MEIVELKKEEYKEYPLEFEYETDRYYDCITEDLDIRFVLKRFDEPVIKRFTDHLFEDYLEEPKAFMISIQGRAVGFLELSFESWHNLTRIANIMVKKDYRHQGFGHALMELAKGVARKRGSRGIILETQSCNFPALSFYFKEGFGLCGCDTKCYTNHDIESREVRMELFYRLEGPKRE
jgi:ribosomal protein S18 acetylase RimI-like enzyme